MESWYKKDVWLCKECNFNKYVNWGIFAKNVMIINFYGLDSGISTPDEEQKSDPISLTSQGEWQLSRRSVSGPLNFEEQSLKVKIDALSHIS